MQRDPAQRATPSRVSSYFLGSSNVVLIDVLYFLYVLSFTSCRLASASLAKKRPRTKGHPEPVEYVCLSSVYAVTVYFVLDFLFSFLTSCRLVSASLAKKRPLTTEPGELCSPFFVCSYLDIPFLFFYLLSLGVGFHSEKKAPYKGPARTW